LTNDGLRDDREDGKKRDTMTSYKKLEAWKKAMQLIKEAYLITKQYPKEELFGLT
jgi:hypothetical protein